MPTSDQHSSASQTNRDKGNQKEGTHPWSRGVSSRIGRRLDGLLVGCPFREVLDSEIASNVRLPSLPNCPLIRLMLWHISHFWDASPLPYFSNRTFEVCHSSVSNFVR